jgi:hypothetical protein
MNLEQAVELVGRWPLDKSVPMQLSSAIQSATGREQAEIALLVEALVVAAETPEDFALLQEYFD